MDTKIIIQLEIKKEKTMKLDLRIKSDKKKIWNTGIIWKKNAEKF